MTSMFALWAGALLALGGPVTEVTITPMATGTSVLIAVDGDVDYRDFTMEGPHRLVVDLMGSRHALPLENYTSVEGGGIRAVRGIDLLHLRPGSFMQNLLPAAAAVAAAGWGLATPREGKLTVVMDGGTATVELDTPSPGRVTSCRTSVSAPAGIAAPVIIRTACPGPTMAAHTC